MIDPLNIAVGATLSTAGAGICTGMFHPRCGLFGRVMYRGPIGARGVALTFDDGPTPEGTAVALDVLAAEQVKATFFVVGLNVEQQPNLVKRIHREGHLVGNHSYHHSHFGVIRRYCYWRAEITRTDDAIERIIGRRPALFRPPMGFKNWHMAVETRRAGLTMVTWSHRALDGFHVTQKKSFTRLAQRAEDGDILTMHDGSEPNVRRDTSALVEFLPELIRSLRARRLKLVRLDELIDVRAYRDTPNR